MAVTKTDPRLIPILTKSNVAALVGAKKADVQRWTSGKDPAVQRGHSLGRSSLSVPFVGLVEADLIQHLNGMGLAQRKINSVLRSMRSSNGELAIVDNPEMVTDGTDLFIREGAALTRTRDSQTSHNKILERWLTRLRVDPDGKVTEYYPEKLEVASVNPRFNGGKLSLTDSRVPVWVIVDELHAGTLPDQIAHNYGVAFEHVEAISREIDWAEEATA